ncbi:MAG: hypothetical protein GEU28_02180 [Dehalococcoidia bacterium]|nr:hypothetical protein [Dehalococcoidia bacterium]
MTTEPALLPWLRPSRPTNVEAAPLQQRLRLSEILAAARSAGYGLPDSDPGPEAVRPSAVSSDRAVRDLRDASVASPHIQREPNAVARTAVYLLLFVATSVALTALVASMISFG